MAAKTCSMYEAPPSFSDLSERPNSSKPTLFLVIASMSDVHVFLCLVSIFCSVYIDCYHNSEVI